MFRSSIAHSPIQFVKWNAHNCTESTDFVLHLGWMSLMLCANVTKQIDELCQWIETKSATFFCHHTSSQSSSIQSRSLQTTKIDSQSVFVVAIQHNFPLERCLKQTNRQEFILKTFFVVVLFNTNDSSLLSWIVDGKDVACLADAR